jgi:hypothetical protein
VTTFLSVALALAVIASFVLFYFGVMGLRKKTMAKQKACMMIAVAIITLLNVVMMSPVFEAQQKIVSAPR